MKISKILSAVAVAAVLSSPVMAKDAGDFSVAIVDVPRVVESSPAVNALRTDRKNKIDDLSKFVESARAAVSKETVESKKKSLEEGYNKELNIKKDAIDKDYTKKLLEIDANITAVIKTKAKAQGFDLVLSKSSVLDGGVDITSEIIKELK